MDLVMLVEVVVRLVSVVGGFGDMKCVGDLGYCSGTFVVFLVSLEL